MFFSDQDFEVIDKEIEAAVNAASSSVRKTATNAVNDLATMGSVIPGPQIRLAKKATTVSATIPEIKLYDDELDRFVIEDEQTSKKPKRGFPLYRQQNKGFWDHHTWLFAIAIWTAAAVALGWIEVKLAACGAGLAAYPFLMLFQRISGIDFRPYRICSIVMTVQGLATYRMLHVVVTPLEAFLLIGILAAFIMTEIAVSMIRKPECR